MCLQFKDGASARGLRPQLVLALIVANEVYDEFNAVCVVTSLADGKHSRESRHYDGAAADLRSKNLGGKGSMVADKIRERLAPLGDFDVIFESAGTDNEHIHVEYQPKLR